MSYQNGTTHYNLPQTVGSDKRDWFDTNEAFREIDEAIHTAVTDSSTALDQIEEVSTNVTAVDTKADSIAGRVTVIEGKQATDEENIAQNAQAISRVESKVDTMSVDLAEMIEVTEEESATASLQHNVGTYFRYNDNLWITTILIRIGDEIVPNVNCETTDVMSRVYALEQGGSGGDSTIIGSITAYAGSTAPSGYLMCDGSAISRTDYADLFAVIGTTYGNGDGSTTFNIPDCRESALVGIGTRGSGVDTHDTYTLGEFKDDQIQQHTHNYNAPAYPSGVYTQSGGTGPSGILASTSENNTGRSGSVTRGKRLGVNYIIKY